jgi:hypothetical protein
MQISANPIFYPNLQGEAFWLTAFFRLGCYNFKLGDGFVETNYSDFKLLKNLK